MFRKLTILIALFINALCFAQANNDAVEIKKYQQIIESNAHDSLKIKALKAWNQLTYLNNPQLDLELNLMIDSICELNIQTELSPNANRFFMKEKADATNIVGINYYYINENAISYYQHCFDLQKQLGNIKGQATAIGNVGVVYFRLNKYDEALEYYLQGLALNIEANDSVRIANSY